MFKNYCRIFILIALSATSATAIADEQLDALIISASSFSEDADKFAGSVSILQPESIESPANANLPDLLQMAPNVNFAGGSSEPRFFQIRGIGELEQYEGAPNPSVGLIYDDLDLSGLGLPFTLFDIEQVEVLRGPQATEFGANGLAGVINFKTTKPTAEESFNSQLSMGSDNLLNVGVAYGSKVMQSEDLTFRLSLANQSQDGFRQNLYTNESDTNERKKSDSRLQVNYQPSKDTLIEAEVMYGLQDDGYDAFSINNGFTTQSDRPGKDRHELYGSKLGITQNISDYAQVKSLTSVSDSSLDYGFDGDWGNNDFWAPYDPYDYRSSSKRDRDVFSQEFRLQSQPEQKNSWLVGFFGQKLDEDTSTQEFANEEIYDSLDSSYEAKSYAGFAALEQFVSETVSIGASFRAEYRDTEYQDSNLQDFSPDFNMQGGSVYVKDQLTDSQHVYALVSRGFKGGGFNSGTRVPDNQIEYSPESLWNYEIGNKGKALDGKLDYSLSTFYMRRNDQQVKLAVQDDPSDPLSFTFLTENAAEGENYGLESTNTYHASDNLKLLFNLGLLKSKITSVDPALSNLLYREQSHAPGWNYSLATVYNLNDNWYFRPSLYGSDSFYFDDSHDQKSNPYTLLGLELGWVKDYLRISLWGRNVTDERYAVRGFYFGNEPPDYPNTQYIQRGDPASFGITISYAY